MNLLIKILLRSGLSVTFILGTLYYCFAFEVKDTPEIILNYTNTEYSVIFRDIERQTGYTTYFSSNTLDGKSRVSINIRTKGISDALSVLFEGKEIDWIIKSNSIVLRKVVKRPRVFSGLDSLPGMLKLFRGSVLDSSNKPIAGAIVSVKGERVSTITDEKGNFELVNVPVRAKLLIRSLGFGNFEEIITQNEMLFILAPKVTELRNVEIIATGYQELDRNRITGSVVKIDNKLYNRQVGSNMLERIYNVTSGLLENPQGASRNTFTIRGYGTLFGNTEPLIVVDNFPFEGNISNINPNDVESITVLKDAAAAAIWGARSGNGVVVVTTKRGGYNNKVKVEFNANATLSEKPSLDYIPMLDSRSMIEFEKSRFASGIYDIYDGIYPLIGFFPIVPSSIELLLKAKRDGIANPLEDKNTLAKLDVLATQDVRKDLSKHFLRVGLNQQYALNVSGGSNIYTYYISGGYDVSHDVNVKNAFKRVSLLWNNNFKLFRNAEMQIQFSHVRTYSDNYGVNYSSLLSGVGNSPYAKLADQYGNSLAITTINGFRQAYIDTAKFPALMDWNYRPLDEYKYVHNSNSENDTRISTSLRYSIFPWLKIEGQYQGQMASSESEANYDINSYYVRNYINQTMNIGPDGKLVYPWPKGNYLDRSNGSLKTWNFRAGFSIDKEFDVHRLTLIGGVEYRQTSTNTFYSKVFGFDPNTYTSQQVNPTASVPTRPRGSMLIGVVNNPSGTLNRFGSYFSNAIYSFLDRYSLSVSGRVDQSNYFGVKANLRKVPLWSVGASWDVKAENMLKAVSWINRLKFKLSYGYTGNALKGSTSYATLKYLTEEYYVPPREQLSFGSVLTPNNPGLTWEKIKIINSGIDFSLFNEKLGGNVEFYIKNGINLFSSYLSDPTVGFGQVMTNNAKLNGRGWDITLFWRNIDIKDFIWQSRLLVSYNKDKITAFSGPEPTAEGVLANSTYLLDFPISSIFSFRSAGLDPKDGSPRVYLGDTIANFRQVNRAKVSDLVFHGQRVPKYFGSFMNDLSWRNLSLSFNIVYRLGYFFRKSSISYSDLLSNGWSSHSDYNLRWKENGDELYTNVPSLPSTPNNQRERAYLRSDVLVERGDHIRLQDIRLSYGAGQRVTKLMRMKSANFYLYASNLWILWKANDSGIDPNAYTFGSMPNLKTISFGLNANF